MEDSEIKMIRHIQTIHPEKTLIVEISGKKTNLVPGKKVADEKDLSEQKPPTT